ncbi:transcriptional repressor [Thermococcus eurythermalis]|uniref:transcriptional repressor n=1 Tax=Thermococcus eurythermalis TaxID=1505907 RepID=UPI001186D7DB|nr:transcriptional repressor [Thermococcus eurythermalis]
MNDAKTIARLLKSLSSETRIELLEIISEKGELSAAEVFREYSQRYKPLRRESIYRELEKMVETGVLSKKYCTRSKKILYYTTINTLVIRLEKGVHVEIISKNSKKE